MFRRWWRWFTRKPLKYVVSIRKFGSGFKDEK